MFLLSLILLSGIQAPLRVNADSSVQNHDDDVVTMPLGWLNAISTAADVFRKSHNDWRCFNLFASKQGDILQVGFTSDFLLTTDPKTHVTTAGPLTKCGKGATYLVTLKGKYIRKLPH